MKTQYFLHPANALLLSSMLACGPSAHRSADVATATPRSDYVIDEITIARLQGDMSAGRVSSEELVRIYLRRIHDLDRRGPALHAVLSVNPKAADDAKRLDRERAEGRVRGPLHGIPVLLKDNIESADPLPTTAGSLALKDNLTGRDAPIVARLRDGGAIILGKANLSEWAYFRSMHATSGWSGAGGLTRNPYALDRNAFGSSSGSGVAVAANLVAVAVGTETNGSITMPAAINGIVGLKPTVGLLSRTHIVPITSSQDTAGPMTRTVADAAVMLTVMAGSDTDDAATREADTKKRDYTTGLSADALQGKRLGVMKFSMGYLPSLDAAFTDAVKQLKAGGAEIVEIAKFDGIDQLYNDEMTIFLADFRREINAYFGTTPAAVQVRTLKDLIAFNAANASREMPFFGQDLLEQSEATAGKNVRAIETLRAKNRKLAGANGIDRLIREYKLHALIAPSTHPATLIDLVNGDHILGGAPPLAAIAGYPHLTVPMGQIQGLPIGMSFIGPAWSEELLLSLGYAFEQRTASRRPPTFPATVELRASAGQ